jgi:hypothetical protein
MHSANPGLFGEDEVERLARRLGKDRAVAMSTASDPFLASISNSRQLSAEWAAELWQAHNFTTGVHLRAIHYVLVSVGAVMADGLPYENTNECQSKLGDALRDARYLGLINADAITDQRNPEVITHLVEPEDARLEVYPGAEFSQLKSAFPRNPCRRLYEPTITQRYHVELWVEKSTQNEILEPLARRYKLNFFGGQGEVSLTRCTELIRRADRSNRPVRILYVSDFDPAGLSMPLTAARKLEFLIREEGLDIDLQVERICLRAAIEKLKYEEPQLAKASQYPDGEDFGSKLDRAIERSHGGKAKLLLMDLRNRAQPPED